MCLVTTKNVQEHPLLFDKLVFLFSFSFVDGREIRKDFHVIDICLIQHLVLLQVEWVVEFEGRFPRMPVLPPPVPLEPPLPRLPHSSSR